MKIEIRYREGLKELMKTMPLEDINVVMLCEYVKSNRQTFYYHYRDIADVIELIFLKERVGYGVKIFSIENVLKPLIAYINSNHQFLHAVAVSFASDKLENFFYSYFYQQSLKYFKHVGLDQRINANDLRDIGRYISSLFSKEMLYWVINKRSEKQNELQTRLTILWNLFIDKYPREKAVMR